MDTTVEPRDDLVSVTEWFAAGRSELLDAFLDEPDAIALLTE